MKKDVMTVEAERGARIMNETTENDYWRNQPTVRSMVIALSNNSLIRWDEKKEKWEVNLKFIEGFCKN